MTTTSSTEKIEYEQRLRRRLKILQEQFEAGKVRVPKGSNIEESLKAVRNGLDGEVDLNTVDATVRSMALAITAFHDREEQKKQISLSEIQNIYFAFIERNFGIFYKAMRDRGLSPHDVGMSAKNNDSSIRELNENLNEFLNIITEFWDSVGETAHIHVEDMHGNVKGVFGGDLFPSHSENIASKCGIYTDTIILPDPFLRSKHVFEHYDPPEKVYYLIKHAMNILQYKDLACTNLSTPIIAILPDLAYLQESEKEFFYNLGKEDLLIHSSHLFGRQFESFEELMDFSKSLDTIERTVAEIADESKVLFNIDWEGDAASKIQRAMESSHMKPLGK